MKQVYHEAICRFEIDDIVTMNGLPDETFKIEEIVLIQTVRANTMEFRFQLSNSRTGEMCDGLFPVHMMGDIVSHD